MMLNNSLQPIVSDCACKRSLRGSCSARGPITLGPVGALAELLRDTVHLPSGLYTAITGSMQSGRPSGRCTSTNLIAARTHAAALRLDKHAVAFETGLASYGQRPLAKQPPDRFRQHGPAHTNGHYNC